MIRGGFLNAEDRRHLIALARDGSAAARQTRRANALVLLDDGWSCQEVAAAFLLPIAAIICPFGPPRHSARRPDRRPRHRRLLGGHYVGHVALQ
jgi:hypothetical protein